MTSRYFEQSQYRTAIFMDNLLSRKSAIVLSGLFGFLAILFLSAGVFRMTKIYLSFAEFSGALCLLSGVYFLFSSYVQDRSSFRLEDLQLAQTQGQYGKGLNFAMTQALQISVDQDVVSEVKLFEYLIHQKEFLWILRRWDVNPEDFLEKLKTYVHLESKPVLADQVLKNALRKALSINRLTVGLPEILSGLFDADSSFKKVLFDFSIEDQDIAEASFWYGKQNLSREQKRRFWRRENLLNTKGIGKNWSGGYTINLDKYAIDITGQIKFSKRNLNLYGHQTQIELLSRMLLQGQGQVALVGDTGVGKHTLIEAFAESLNVGRIYSPLRFMRVLQIDSGAVLAGASNLNEVVQKIEILFNEAYRAGNIILVINNIDAFLDSRTEAGRVNATEALMPYFESPLKIIGITDPNGFQSTIGKNPQLSRYFSKLEILEPSALQTLWILEDVSIHLERRTGVLFTLQSLREVVNLANRLVQNLPNPEKSIEIMENTAIHVATNTTDRVVTPDHVRLVASLRTRIPVEQVSGLEKDKLLAMEELLHKRIIGQNEAIASLANSLRRARSGIRSEKKPMGSFLFLGPTGVGKTETTKALANLYFGSEQKMIRFDMSEFQETRSIARFIGNPETGESGMLTNSVMENPFSLILLDEIEKAHPRILDIFLQVLDEGRLTDVVGKTVSFVHTMIIATSNAGAEIIRTMVKDEKNPSIPENRDIILDFLQKQGVFRPEFLNRFDAVLVFRPLSADELYDVTTLLIAELNARLVEKDIQVLVTPELIAWVVKHGYHPELGARPLRRVIQEKLENHIAQGLLSGTIKRGDKVEIPLYD